MEISPSIMGRKSRDTKKAGSLSLDDVKPAEQNEWKTSIADLEMELSDDEKIGIYFFTLDTLFNF